MLLNHNIPFNESRSIGRVQRGQPLKHDGGRATVDRDRERAASSVQWGVDPLEAGGSLAGHALMVCICNSRLLYIHVCVTSIFCICICICICACSPGSAQDPLQDRRKRGPDSYGLPKSKNTKYSCDTGQTRNNPIGRPSQSAGGTCENMRGARIYQSSACAPENQKPNAFSRLL